MNFFISSDDSWFCSKPKVFPQLGTIPTSWTNLRHVRLKRQIPFDVGGSEYQLMKYKDHNRRDFDPYDYVDRSYGHHDPYHVSGYGSHSGYGHASYDDHGHDCCPLVVDPLTLCALLAFIAAATYFLRRAITMNMNIVG